MKTANFLWKKFSFGYMENPYYWEVSNYGDLIF